MPSFLKAATIIQPSGNKPKVIAPFFFKGTARFALTPVSDTEAVVSGLGRSLGETVRAVLVDGQERIAYSGYLLRPQGDP